VNDSEPLSSARAIWLIVRLAVRRQLNIYRLLRPAAPSPGADPRRPGQSGTSLGRAAIGLVFVLLFFWSGYGINSGVLVALSFATQKGATATDKIIVTQPGFSQLSWAEGARKKGEQIPDARIRAEYLSRISTYADLVLSREVRFLPLSAEEKNARLKEMQVVFERKGAAGFIADAPAGFVSSRTWPSNPAASRIFLRCLEVGSLFWIPFLIAVPLGLGRQALGRLDWNLEWMFTFPVSSRAIFAAKLLEYSFLNPAGWCFVFPFFIVAFVAGGFGQNAIALGLASTVYLFLLTGSVMLIAEIVLSRWTTAGRIRNVQALLSIIGSMAFFLFFGLRAETVGNFLARHLGSLPAFIFWNPFSLPLLIADPAMRAWPAATVAAAALVIASTSAWLALATCERLTSTGLLVTTGAYEGARGTHARISRPSRLRGIVAIEWLLLKRDRNLEAQAFVIPIAMPAIYIVLNPHWFSAIMRNFRYAGLLVFAVGAYASIATGVLLVSREARTLPLLASFPRSLVRTLFQKATFWAAASAIHGLLMLAALAYFHPNLNVSAIRFGFLAVYGIALYSLVGSALSILGTNPQLEAQGPSPPGAGLSRAVIFLQMFLGALYASVFLIPITWIEIALMLLATLLAIQLWREAIHRCVYLLDPSSRPG
jgi:hypothetical protein